MSCQKISLISRELIQKGFVGRNAVQKRTFSKNVNCQNSKGSLKFDRPLVSKWKEVYSRLIAEDSKAKHLLVKINDTLNVISVMFAKQCHAIAAQRIRRAAQIMDLYAQLYDHRGLQQFIQRLRSQFLKNKKDKPLYMLFGAVLFRWDQHKITDEEVNRFVSPIAQSNLLLMFVSHT